jgi:hypothetical protein
MQPGTAGCSMLHRQWMGLNDGDPMQVAPLDISHMGKDIILAGLDLAVGFMKARIVVEEVFSIDDLSQFFHDNYDQMMCTPGQMFFFDYHGQKMKATVKGMFRGSPRFTISNIYSTRVSACRSTPSRKIWPPGQCYRHYDCQSGRQQYQVQEQCQETATKCDPCP